MAAWDSHSSPALIDQLSHIDHAVAIFGYAKPPGDIKPKAVRLFKRNELARLMRREGTEGTNREIALRIIAAKGWDADDRDMLAKLMASVRARRSGTTDTCSVMDAKGNASWERR